MWQGGAEGGGGGEGGEGGGESVYLRVFFYKNSLLNICFSAS